MRSARLKDSIRRAIAFGPVYADMKRCFSDPKQKQLRVSRPAPAGAGLAEQIRAALAQRDMDYIELKAACPLAADMSVAGFQNNLYQLVSRGRIVKIGETRTHARRRASARTKEHAIHQRLTVWGLGAWPAAPMQYQAAENAPSWLVRAHG